MPLEFSRRLAGRERTPRSDRQLGCMLAFVAGATNASGFLAVHRYTSHMTGIVSAMADDFALGTFDLVVSGLGALLSFVLGASVTAVLVNYARHRRRRSEFALPLILEACCLLCFGIVTDIGIELGKLFYWNSRRSPTRTRVVSNRKHLAILAMLGCSFFIGGVLGAFGFRHAGYVATVPLALALIAISIVPAIDDIVASWRDAGGHDDR